MVASCFFKWGSLSPDKYWWGFAFGNLFGMTSIIMLINVYKVLSPAATLAICTGGAFVLNQIGFSTTGFVVRLERYRLDYSGNSGLLRYKVGRPDE